MFRRLVSRILTFSHIRSSFFNTRHGLSSTDTLYFARPGCKSAAMSGPLDRFVVRADRSTKAKDKSPARNEHRSPSSPNIGGEGQQIRRVTRDAVAQSDREKYLKMTKEEKRELYKCGSKFLSHQDIHTWPEYLEANREKHHISVNKHKPRYKVNEKLNSKVSLWRGDITTLEIDAIVNAANNSLLGGGGVDGAIHSAAGSKLRQECSTLGRCDTGDAKMSAGYKLPAKYVIHTVGPIGEQERLLLSAYKTCLKIVRENQLRSVAFPCISTGIYGYPNSSATPLAIETVRSFLEDDKVADMIDRIIFCLFLPVDVKLYEEFMPVFFPVEENELNSTDCGKDKNSASAEKSSKYKKREVKKTGESAEKEKAAVGKNSPDQNVDKRSHPKEENSSPGKSPEIKRRSPAQGQDENVRCEGEAENQEGDKGAEGKKHEEKGADGKCEDKGREMKEYEAVSQ